MSVEQTKTEFISAFQVLVDEYTLAKAKIVERVKESLGAEVSRVLSKSNKINNIYWNAYTDYFNDGEECNFHTSIDDLRVNVDPNERYKEDGDNFLEKTIWDNGRKPNPDYDPYEVSIMDELNTLFEPLNDDDLLKDIFGDHVEITIHKSGLVDVKPYTEHD